MDMENEYSRRLSEMQEAIAEVVGEDLIEVVYSAYKTDAEGLPINNLNDVAIQGTVVLIQGYDDFWGIGGGKDYKSEPITNPTWLQLAVLANASILTTGDYHHVFLEGVHEVSPGVYQFSFGS